MPSEDQLETFEIFLRVAGASGYSSDRGTESLLNFPEVEVQQTYRTPPKSTSALAVDSTSGTAGYTCDHASTVYVNGRKVLRTFYSRS